MFDERKCFSFTRVKYTQKQLVIPLYLITKKVYLEVDILEKYVEKLRSSGFVESINKECTM